MSNYTIGEKLFMFNLGAPEPLVMDFIVHGIIKNEDGVFYSPDRSVWVKADKVYRSKKDAYNALINQAEDELRNVEKEKLS